MISSRTALAALLGAGVLGLAACGGYDRQEAIDDLQADAGLTEAQATCVVDELENKIGVDRLGERGSELTAEEEQIVIEATTTCVLGG